MRPRRLARWLASRWGPRVAVLLGVLLALPALRIGLVHDDLFHRVFLEGAVPDVAQPPFGLYDFTGEDPSTVPRLIDHGYLPWFTHRGFSLRFFRPLSSWLLTVDHSLFGRSALAAHAHSLVWLALAIAIAAALFRRVLRPTSATFATLAYALAGSHGVTAAWIAARHGLVAATLGGLAILAHVRSREDGSRAGVLLSPLFFVCAALASEMALCTAVFIVLYELIVARGAVQRRALATLPVIAVALAYLAFYAHGGYGTRHSGTYVSPFDAPLSFAGAVVTRGPVMLGEMYAGFPLLVSGFVEDLQPAAAISGVAALAFAAWLLYRARLRSRALRRVLWMGASSIVCLVPLVGGILDPRSLSIAILGSSAVLGAVIVESLRRARAQRGAARFGLRSAVAILLSLHVALPVLGRLALSDALVTMSEIERRAVVGADLRACPDGANAYLLTGADPALSIFAMPALSLFEPREAERLGRIRVVSMAPQAQELRVVDGHHFELRVIEPRTATIFERLYRDEPVERGVRYGAGELSVSVREVEGGLPVDLELTERRGLDTSCFLVWRAGRLRAVRPPPVGRVEPIPHEPGPLGL